jgi:hypothetical protein
MASGDLITYGVSPDGFTTTESPADLEALRTTIVLSLTGHNSLGELVDSQYAVFDGAHLSADHWVSQDGAEASEPCSRRAS